MLIEFNYLLTCELYSSWKTLTWSMLNWNRLRMDGEEKKNTPKQSGYSWTNKNIWDSEPNLCKLQLNGWGRCLAYSNFGLNKFIGSFTKKGWCDVGIRLSSRKAICQKNAKIYFNSFINHYVGKGYDLWWSTWQHKAPELYYLQFTLFYPRMITLHLTTRQKEKSLLGSLKRIKT
jgi:hypothetical protein